MIAIEDIKIKYGTEIALIVLCCRVHFTTEDQTALQNFINTSVIDWNDAIFLSANHRIEPIIYKILQKATIPADVANRIKQNQFHLIQNSFKLALETERIINKLAGHNIRCLTYKGTALSKQLYGDIVSRESSDIDLVIATADFDSVINLMQEDGYTFESLLEYNYYKDDVYKRNKDLSFNKYENDSRQFHVEFHWGVVDPTSGVKSSANNVLFDETTRMQLAKSEVEVLNISSHYLAVFLHHSVADGFSILRNLVDIGQIIFLKDIINTAYINQSISGLRLKKAPAICQFICKELLGIAVPLSVSVNLTTSEKDFFIEQLLNKKMLGSNFKAQLFKKSIYYLKDNATDKFRYLLRSFLLRFTPSRKDIRIFNLPRKLHFLYPVLKPFRSVFSPSTRAEETEMARQQKKIPLSK